MNLKEKTDLVRRVAKETEDSKETNAVLLAKELESSGFICNEYVGADKEIMTPEHTLDWYAGQYISIVKEEAWFAMNSWLNCVDKFAPNNDI